MKNSTEKPTVIGVRVYKHHRKMVHNLAKKLKITNAEVVRAAIEEKYEKRYGENTPLRAIAYDPNKIDLETRP